MDDEKIFQISLDDKPYKVKKFKLKENLSDVRKVLNISESYEFINENGKNVEIGDEENFTLDNLFENKKKKIFSLKCKKCTKNIIVVINNEKQIQIECFLKDNLLTIREKINKEIKEKFIFILDDFPLEESDEGGFIVNDIINDNKIYIKLNDNLNNNSNDLNDSNNSNDLNNCSKNEIYYSIVCDNKNIGKHKFPNSFTLEEIRKKLDSLIPENSFFLNKNEMIPKISEKYIDVNKIINESNTIFLQSNLKIEEDNNSKNILKEDKLNEEKKDLSQKEIPKEKMKYNNSKDLFLEKKLDDISLSHEINDKSTDSFKEVVLEKSEQILQNKKNENFNDGIKKSL